MLFVAAGCITLCDVVAMAVTHHGSVPSVTEVTAAPTPAAQVRCLAAPIPSQRAAALLMGVERRLLRPGFVQSRACVRCGSSPRPGHVGR